MFIGANPACFAKRRKKGAFLPAAGNRGRILKPGRFKLFQACKSGKYLLFEFIDENPCKVQRVCGLPVSL